MPDTTPLAAPATRIGFIGLGAMGSAIVPHLMKAGHALTLYARRPEVLAPFLAAGASAAASPGEVAGQSDVVFTMVTGTHDVHQVLFGPGGIVEGGRRGLLLVDMSTIAPAAARAHATELEARGIEVVDAPVSGGPDGAKNGTLTIMAGGSPGAFARATPLFACFGATILHMGPSGAGQATKACHQLLLLITAEGVAESLALAARAGVDPALARQAMMSGIASSRVLDRFGARMAARNFENGISARLYRKDLDIILEYARALGAATPAGELTMRHLQRLIDGGRAESDLSALITVVESTL